MSCQEDILELDKDDRKVNVSIEIERYFFYDIISDYRYVNKYIDDGRIFKFVHTILKALDDDRLWFYIGSCEVAKYYFFGYQSYIDILLENGLLKHAWKADELPPKPPFCIDDISDDLPF